MSFLHGLNYLRNSVVILAGLVCLAVLVATGITPGAIPLVSAPRLALLLVVLYACDLYRQRFYLDRRTEWGCHWRVAVLHYAKWPYFLLALLDVITARRLSYVLTRKMRADSSRGMVFWPQVLVVAGIAGAWVVGRACGRTGDPVVGLLAVAIVMASLGLLVTERFTFPEPYDRSLLDAHNE